jgi:hypothetical protein
MIRALFIAAAALCLACGGVVVSPPSLNVRAALTGAPEAVLAEPTASRADLFAEVARASLEESGRAAGPEVLFPIVQDGSAIAAPGFDPRTDLLAGADAGDPLWLNLDEGTEPWPELRRPSLQGLSEKEAAELVARSLIARWDLHPHGEIAIERASGAPYAAAWADGVLRVNPSFLYLAAAVGPQTAP